MKTVKIEKLLERYYNGETSLEEEQMLMRFFSEEEVPPHLQADKACFERLSCLQDEVPEGHTPSVEAWIDRWAAEEKQSVVRKKSFRLLRWQWATSIAAGICLLCLVGTYFHARSSYPPAMKNNEALTHEMAYLEAEKALLLFSAKLNKGLEQVEVLPQTTEKIQETVREQMKKLK